MEEKYTKAEECLQKGFYFRQVDADEAEARGAVLMEKDDIKYLLSFKIDKPSNATLDMTGVEYHSKKVLAFVKKSKEEGFDCVTLIDKDLTNTDYFFLKKEGYFIELDYPGCKVTYIFFTKEKHIDCMISDFQEMLGAFIDFANDGVI